MESGIYAIIHIETGRRYVGQSITLSKRRRAHFGLLRRGAHHCPRLQRAFARDGEAAFRFEVIETCPHDDLTAREQHWMDHHRPAGIYNAAPAAGSPRGIKRTPEQIRANSEYRKGRPTGRKGSKHSPEALARMSAVKKGKRPTDETRAKLSAARKGRGLSDAHRKALSEAAKGKPKSREAVEKRRAKMTGRPMSEAAKAKLREVHLARRDEASRIAREQWARPGAKEAATAARTGRTASAETRLKLSAKSKAMWAARKSRAT